MSFRIAIIDQGVDHDHDRLKDCNISGITMLKTAEGYTLRNDVYADDTGHGTGIAAIIHKMAPDQPLLCVKIASEDKRLSEDLLTEAIGYCLEQKDVRIINISMGIPTENPSAQLYEMCNKAERNNVLIVAAAYNFPDTSCYPAHFPTVYGVSTGLVSNKYEYGYSEEGPINILAKGTTQRVATLDNGYRISSGTSFATAHFSGIAAVLLKDSPVAAIAEWRQVLCQGAKKGVQQLLYFRNDVRTKVYKKDRQQFEEEGRQLFTSIGRAAFAEKIAIFPVSEKEMKTVLEFPEHCRFIVTCLLDYPVRMIMQADGKKAGIPPVIRDLKKIDLSSFDTIVCGYFLDQLVDANIAFSISLVQKCLDQNKHFICWDVDVYHLIKKFIGERGPACTSRIEVARVTREMYNDIREYNNLPFLKTPVISVVGTSNRQGKITAQLRIKQILEDTGYKVSHISTEPQGMLFGADLVFPYGYKCPIEPPEQEWSRLLRIALRGVQRYNQPDVILTGTQGGLLPRTRAISNELGHDLSSLHFLLGVQPDAICCAINPEDEAEMILQSIGVIQSYCKSKLLFYFMTPWARTILTDEGMQNSLSRRHLLKKEEREEKMHLLSKRLGASVIDIMDAGNDGFILNAIQEAFSVPLEVVP